MPTICSSTWKRCIETPKTPTAVPFIKLNRKSKLFWIFMTVEYFLICAPICIFLATKNATNKVFVLANNCWNWNSICTCMESKARILIRKRRRHLEDHTTFGKRCEAFWLTCSCCRSSFLASIIKLVFFFWNCLAELRIRQLDCYS